MQRQFATVTVGVVPVQYGSCISVIMRTVTVCY